MGERCESSGETGWLLMTGHLLSEISITCKESTLLLPVLIFLHSGLTVAYRTTDYEIHVDIFIVLSLISSDMAGTRFLVTSVSRPFCDIGSSTACFESNLF